ncbi:MAG: hypothetical protein AVDCRST_MAG88-4095, partial [uncultured Thermomicrobiales bacterium]
WADPVAPDDLRVSDEMLMHHQGASMSGGGEPPTPPGRSCAISCNASASASSGRSTSCTSVVISGCGGRQGCPTSVQTR